MSNRLGIDWDAHRYAVMIGNYRYWLHQRLVGREGVTVFCMLNPSKANGIRNDPTSRRCIDFATLWDSGMVILVNLYAAVATEPDELMEHDNPMGQRNADYIKQACHLVKRQGGRFVVAWGAHPMARLQAPVMLDFIRAEGVKPKCIGMTKEGQPRHPLMVPSTQELEAYGR